jgi:exosortase K
VTRHATAGAAVVIAWGLKRHYADARPDDLLWILSPTAWLAGFVSGTAFEFQPGEGYLSREHLFLIEKSCAGINFMIAAFGMLVFSLHQADLKVRTTTVLGVSLLASYAAAVVVNAVRIVVAMWLAAHPIGALSAADVHRLEGIAVYFGGLVLLHEAVGVVRTFRSAGVLRAFRPAVPLAFYYAVTLGVPLANGAASSGATFVEHALIVLAVPVAAVVMVWAGARVIRSGLLPASAGALVSTSGLQRASRQRTAATQTASARSSAFPATPTTSATGDRRTASRTPAPRAA